MDPATAAKVILVVAKALAVGVTLIISIKALLTGFGCFKDSTFREFLNTFKWLLIAILLNLIIN